NISDWIFVPSDCNVTDKAEQSAVSLDETFHSMMVTLGDNRLVIRVSNDSRVKHKTGDPLLRLLFSVDYEFTKNEKASFLIQGKKSLSLFPDKMIRPGKIGMTDYYVHLPGEYEIFLPINGTVHEEEPIGRIKLNSGGSYTVFILQKASWNIRTTHILTTVDVNEVHRLWQIPQAIVIAAGEVMFSVTGLDFSYSQAPSSLKSLVQALWLLTNAVGNFLIILLNFLKFERVSYEFLMYAALMALSMGIFVVIAVSYEYVEYDEKS
ncbi:solute carrier family 15 member 2, partial [Nephila pilipes]